jgi:hypothetical protein
MPNCGSKVLEQGMGATIDGIAGNDVITFSAKLSRAQAMADMPLAVHTANSVPSMADR